MAKRRMFSMDIVGSDAFLDMGVSARELYFQLGMYADDDGFITPKRIMRMIGSTEDDLRVLLAKRFILDTGNGVIVIKHWKANNYIQKDRYQKTRYIENLQHVEVKENGDYTEKTSNSPLLDTECIQDVNFSDTQVRLGKVRLGNKETNVSDEMQSIYALFIKSFKKNENTYKLSPARKAKLKVRLNDAGKEMIEKAIINVSNSPFHMGDNDRGWTADLDFIIRSYEQVEKLAAMNNKSSVEGKNPNDVIDETWEYML